MNDLEFEIPAPVNSKSGLKNPSLATEYTKFVDYTCIYALELKLGYHDTMECYNFDNDLNLHFKFSKVRVIRDENLRGFPSFFYRF